MFYIRKCNPQSTYLFAGWVISNKTQQEVSIQDGKSSNPRIVYLLPDGSLCSYSPYLAQNKTYVHPTRESARETLKRFKQNL